MQERLENIEHLEYLMSASSFCHTWGVDIRRDTTSSLDYCAKLWCKEGDGVLSLVRETQTMCLRTLRPDRLVGLNPGRNCEEYGIRVGPGD